MLKNLGQKLLLDPYYRGGSKHPMRASNWPGATQQQSDRAGVHTKAVFIESILSCKAFIQHRAGIHPLSTQYVQVTNIFWGWGFRFWIPTPKGSSSHTGLQSLSCIPPICFSPRSEKEDQMPCPTPLDRATVARAVSPHRLLINLLPTQSHWKFQFASWAQMRVS